jgi:DNA repair protein RadC
VNDDRILKRFLHTETDTLAESELLELLLRYCSEPEPERKAQELLEYYNNLANLLDARGEDLTDAQLSLKGIALIRLVTDLHRRYLLIRSRTDQFLLDHKSMAHYLLPLFMGLQEESVYLLCLDAARMVLSCNKLTDGEVNSVNIPVRALVREALHKNATYVVLAHNHPSGMGVPSITDIESTKQIQEVLYPLNITLLDHIVFTNDSYVSMRECGYYQCGPFHY